MRQNSYHLRNTGIIGVMLFTIFNGSIALVACADAAEQAEAEVLVARAIPLFEAQQYDEALELLHGATDADPKNTRALYYTGLTYLALKQPEQAIPPLEKARKIRPEDAHVKFQLGVAYFTLGKYDQSTPLFDEVYRMQPNLENLGYYIGFGRYRRQEYKEAVTAFEAPSITDPNVRQLAGFYRGLALAVLGLSKESTAQLSDLQLSQAGDPFSQAAARIGQKLSLAREAEEPRRFRGQVSVGGFYDDNVAINPNPSNDPTAEDLRRRKTTSPGLLASVLADYTFYRQGQFESTITYSFLQTLNFNDPLDAFNLQSHLGGISSFYRGAIANIPYQLAAQYTYDYLFLGGDGFLSRHTPTFSVTVVPPSVILPWVGEVSNLTTAFYRYQVKEFYREPGNSDVRFVSELRDAYNNAVGFVHVLRFAQDKYLLRAGYQYDNEAAEGAAFTYTGNRLQAGGQVALPWANISLRYDYDVHWRAYKNAQGLFFNDEGVRSQRYDIEQTHLVQIIKPLADNLTLTAQYQRIRNDTNIPVYDYTKNVYTATVTWTF